MNTHSVRPQRWASHLWLYLLSALAAFAAAPNLTSVTTDDTTVGASYTYDITTDVDGDLNDAPLGYSLSGQPFWLTRTGNQISGTPPETGVFTFDVSAFNGDGSDTQTVTLSVFASPFPPIFTSATNVTGILGQPFSYTATADNPPLTWNVLGTLPSGLSFDSATG
ncbi:MAG: putative Ig domain-containing protein, partial [Opitutales bacterium]